MTRTFRLLPLAAAGLLSATPVLAQETLSGGLAVVDSTVAKLVADGYEIKAAVPNGAKYVVFLQKGEKAFACEFVTLTQSRCGEIR